MGEKMERTLAPATGDVGQYIGVMEAARRKGVTRSAIYQAVDAGRLPMFDLAGRCVLRISDVEKYEPLRQADRKGAQLKTWKGKRGPGRPRKTEISAGMNPA